MRSTACKASGSLRRTEPRPKLPQASLVFLLQRFPWRVFATPPCVDNQVQRRVSESVVITSEQLPQPTPTTVAHYSAADLPGGCDAEPAAGHVTGPWQCKEHDVPSAGATTLLVDLEKLGPSPQDSGPPEAAPVQTAIRLRPFRRLWFRTRRPPLLRIRILKPWVFFRRLLLG